jgi:cysteinyl-tRNA synthetase, unknown class
MTLLTDAKTWLYHLGDVSNARADAIAATNADLVITEWASYAQGEDPYRAADLDRMRGADQDRLIVSYLSIGEAETYRYYWQSGWQDAPPAWIGEANPEWEGNIKVRYWQDAWQQIILDYLDRIIDAGFNGVYLDIIDAFQYWTEERPNSSIDFAQEMADFVALIRSHAAERLAEVDPGRPFYIIGQNGVELLDNPTYRAAVDGVAQEDLRFIYENGQPQDFAPQSNADFRYGLDLLKAAEADGIATFVVEYIPPAARGGAATLLAAEAAALRAAGIPIYVADNRDLDGIDPQPGVIGSPATGPAFTRPGVSLIGGDRADALTGKAAAEFITGRGGADTLFGRDGGDQIFGGKSGDRVGGGNGRDLVFGGTGADSLTGGDGRDRLYGGRGDDTLRGGDARDILDGGAGADRFILRTGSGHDTLYGFDPDAGDVIDLPGTPRITAHDRGTLIRMGEGDSLLVIGLTPGQIPDDSIL